LRGKLPQIEAKGAQLIFVGNGSVKFAARFQEDKVPGIPVYTDPSLSTFSAAGLKRGIGATLSLGSLLAGARSTLRGHRQTSVQGDPWQQGGVIVVARGGEVVYRRPNQHAGERPDLAAALAAL